jgi:hypothetical protein
MPFLYKQGGRLEDILVEALKYARTEDMDAVFVFNDINIVVTERSNLAYIWSDFHGARTGRTVGPCEVGLSNTVSLPAGYHDLPDFQRKQTFVVIHKLLEASR